MSVMSGARAAPARGGDPNAINLAALVQDGVQIVVPAPCVRRRRGRGAAAGRRRTAPAAPVNLNTATGRAARDARRRRAGDGGEILEYRTQNGGFRTRRRPRPGLRHRAQAPRGPARQGRGVSRTAGGGARRRPSAPPGARRRGRRAPAGPRARARAALAVVGAGRVALVRGAAPRGRLRGSRCRSRSRRWRCPLGAWARAGPADGAGPRRALRAVARPRRRRAGARAPAAAAALVRAPAALARLASGRARRAVRGRRRGPSRRQVGDEVRVRGGWRALPAVRAARCAAPGRTR